MNPFQHHTRNRLHPFACLLSLVLILGAGCTGGDFGTVTGTVTADGEPLPNAMITFFPRPEGRASKAMTNENGAYELIYSRDRKGALAGEHMVQITTAVETGDYGDVIAPETLPAKYNVASELMEEVKPGRNVIDFALDYEGEIVENAY